MQHPFDLSIVDAARTKLGSGSVNIFGRPFAGKDTQGRTLADLLDGTLLGGGDILRNSVIPERSRLAQDKGELIPTDDFVEIVLPYLSTEAFAGKPLILSSVGRWHGEEEGVMDAAQQSGHPVRHVIFLELSESIVWERFEKEQDARSFGERGNRTDDHKDILQKRLQEFNEKTLPVLQYYEARGLLKTLDANRPAVEITADLLKVLAS